MSGLFYARMLSTFLIYVGIFVGISGWIFFETAELSGRGSYPERYSTAALMLGLAIAGPAAITRYYQRERKS